MLKKIIIPALLLLFISCEKEDDMTPAIYPVPNGPSLIFKGSFVPTSGITVSGEAKIYVENTARKVVLENFSISDGPDLKVYLSKSDTPNDFVNLGDLTAATVYSIPEQVNLTQYKYVLIHCQQFNHLFAIAELSMN